MVLFSMWVCVPSTKTPCLSLASIWLPRTGVSLVPAERETPFKALASIRLAWTWLPVEFTQTPLFWFATISLSRTVTPGLVSQAEMPVHPLFLIELASMRAPGLWETAMPRYVLFSIVLFTTRTLSAFQRWTPRWESVSTLSRSSTWADVSARRTAGVSASPAMHQRSIT